MSVKASTERDVWAEYAEAGTAALRAKVKEEEGVVAGTVIEVVKRGP